MADKPDKKLPMLAVLSSTLAAFFGVQSEHNRARDFNQGDPMQYIVMGVVATLGVILGLAAIVYWILN